MARSSTGTAVSNGVYTTLYDPAVDGPWSKILIWITSGTATIRIAGFYDGSNVLSLTTTNDIYTPFIFAPNGSNVPKLEAAGSGGAATVAFAGIG